MTSRRGAIAGSLAVTLLGRAAFAASGQEDAMFGMIGRMIAKPGQRDALVRLLLEGSGEMPGCLSYIIAEDAEDPDAIWVTEAWDSQASHKASLELPAVRAAIAGAKPLIADFRTAAITHPVGGIGL